MNVSKIIKFVIAIVIAIVLTGTVLYVKLRKDEPVMNDVSKVVDNVSVENGTEESEEKAPFISAELHGQENYSLEELVEKMPNLNETKKDKNNVASKNNDDVAKNMPNLNL